MNFNETEERVILGSCGWRDAESGATPKVVMQYPEEKWDASSIQLSGLRLPYFHLEMKHALLRGIAKLWVGTRGSLVRQGAPTDERAARPYLPTSSNDFFDVFCSALIFMILCAPLLIASEVKIESAAQGQHRLLRDDQPYLVKGANWPTVATIEALVAAGGNSIRTYHDEVEWMLPLAKKHRLSLMFGLHIGRERQYFDYENPEAVAAQLETIRATVRKYKNEPEVLFWAIGNESELKAKKTIPLWKAVNDIARMIHEEDPHHPVVTVIAGFDEKKIRELIDYCPDLDALGVNWYGPATQWPQNLVKFGWKKPYLLTEFGPNGYWPGAEGGGMTQWGAPIEQNSAAKARLYADNWRDAVLAQPGQSFGGYAFIWGQKQERTNTWFSMHLFTGERTPMVDAMQEVWTGHPPKNPAPEILEVAPVSGTFAPGEIIPVTCRWTCNRPTKLTVSTYAESLANETGGDKEIAPKLLPKTVWQHRADTIEITAPDQPGNYRVFLQITTDDHTAATANIPIQIQTK